MAPKDNQTTPVCAASQVGESQVFPPDNSHATKNHPTQQDAATEASSDGAESLLNNVPRRDVAVTIQEISEDDFYDDYTLPDVHAEDDSTEDSVFNEVEVLSEGPFTRFVQNFGYFIVRIGEKIYRSKTWQTLIELPPFSTLRRSLVARFTTIVAVIVVVTMAVLSLFVTTYVRSGLFEARVTKILQDASIRTQTIQDVFDQTTVHRIEDVQDLAYQLMSTQREASAGAGGIGVMLLHPRTKDSAVHINELVDSPVRQTLTKEMRTTIEKEGGQHWQSVDVSTGSGSTPGIIVGSTLILPVVGEYEFYIVYTLGPEQNTIDMINQVMLIGTFVLLLFLIVLMALLGYQLLMPIRRTAHAVKRVATGDLEVRIPVDGKDELAVLSASFNHMAAALEEQIVNYEELAQLQQRFVSDVSHELRTPLSSIRIAADLIYDDVDSLPSYLQRSAEILHSQVDRFDRMLADLLEVSRIDARTAQLELAEQDIVALVRATVQDNAPLAERLGVEVNVNVCQGIHEAEADAIRIQRIIRNLLVNAYEYAEGSPVDVMVASTEQCVAVRVRDYGAGMTDEVASHVFDRFYRADPSRQRTTGGTGLGLAIAAEDAALHHGVLTVLACPKEGASFLLVLPKKPGQSIEALPEEVFDRRMMEARFEWAKHHPDDIWFLVDDHEHENSEGLGGSDDIFASAEFSEFDDEELEDTHFEHLLDMAAQPEDSQKESVQESDNEQAQGARR
ncbi:MAG: MtrAB system histidine kinase MtrB [Actinomycetaceae bacterium]|nr:MtrAB system histidine kinase MtrB [Actinomycetaceae bacterium]